MTPKPRNDPSDALGKVAEVLGITDPASMTLGELEAALTRRLGLGSIFEERLHALTHPPLRYKRRPRREQVVTYRVRADLRGTKPPLWRRLQLASDLDLAEVHAVLQIAFGWTDTHLHGFAAGPDFYSREAERYLCPFDVENGEEGIPEEQVRLDEVLADIGDKLSYTYDYGDDWRHVLKLEAISPRQDGEPRARCTAGRRDGPPEDCGGIYGYELIAAATDPLTDEPDIVITFDRLIGTDPERARMTPFNPGEINAQLVRLGLLLALLSHAQQPASQRTSTSVQLAAP